MLTLVEVLAAELNKKSSLIFGHSLGGVVESVIKTSVMAQENQEDLSRVMVKIKGASDADTYVLPTFSVPHVISLTPQASTLFLSHPCHATPRHGMPRDCWLLAARKDGSFFPRLCEGVALD